MRENEFVDQVRNAVQSRLPRLFLSNHAKERMLERQVTIAQVKRILLKANIEEGPYQETNGDWKCNFRSVDSGQDICVVVAIKKPEQGEPVFVVTVIDKSA